MEPRTPPSGNNVVGFEEMRWSQMSFYECLTAFVFVSVTTLLGQEGQGSAAWARLQRIDRVLRSAHSSGSLVYQGYCGNTLPEAPPVRSLSDDSGAPIAVLQKMLGNPPDVLVTQEPNGMVRMVQTNVPTDLLDLRIQHMAFYGSSDDGSQGPWHGAKTGNRTVRLGFYERH